MSLNPTWAHRTRIAICSCISGTALFLGWAYVFGVNHVFGLNFAQWRFDRKALGFLVAAALPWVVDRIESFKGFGFEIKQKLDAQDKKLQRQQELLNLMFWFSMESDMFDTLKNLVQAPVFIHNPEDQRFYPIVNAQLKELFNRGFIDRDPASIALKEDIGDGKIVTEVGKTFVSERLKLEATGARNRLEKLSPLSATAQDESNT
ncbi:MAG: hypothetical protein M3Y72_03870 [Acidobacteriota bacterium]|nr:hypothetical protein [Acidobacteriota bacterium]